MRPKYLIYLPDKFPLGILISLNGFISVYARTEILEDEIKEILKSFQVGRIRLVKLTKHNTNKFHYHFVMPMQYVKVFIENLEHFEMYQIKRVRTFGRMYR